jgi:hypothetical protein
LTIYRGRVDDANRRVRTARTGRETPVPLFRVPLSRHSSGARFALSASRDVALRHQHDLPRHASTPEQLMRPPCLGKRKSLRNEWLDLLLFKKVKQSGQILSK